MFNKDVKSIAKYGVVGAALFAFGAVATTGRALDDLRYYFDTIVSWFSPKNDDRYAKNETSPQVYEVDRGGPFSPPLESWQPAFKVGWVYYENSKDGRYGHDTQFGVNGKWHALPDFMDLRVNDIIMAGNAVSVRFRPGSGLQKIDTMRRFECARIIANPQVEYAIDVSFARSGGWVKVRHQKCPEQYSRSAESYF